MYLRFVCIYEHCNIVCYTFLFKIKQRTSVLSFIILHSIISTSCPATNNVDLPWYTSLWRLKECHLLFRCCPLFVVLNNDLIFICRRHGYNASPTSRFFFSFCRGTAGYTTTCPWTLQTSYCVGYGVGPTQKYKAALIH